MIPSSCAAPQPSLLRPLSELQCVCSNLQPTPHPHPTPPPPVPYSLPHPTPPHPRVFTCLHPFCSPTWPLWGATAPPPKCPLTVCSHKRTPPTSLAAPRLPFVTGVRLARARGTDRTPCAQGFRETRGSSEPHAEGRARRAHVCAVTQDACQVYWRAPEKNRGTIFCSKSSCASGSDMLFYKCTRSLAASTNGGKRGITASLVSIGAFGYGLDGSGQETPGNAA